MFANIENPPETVNVTFEQNDFMNICPISMYSSGVSWVVEFQVWWPKISFIS